jgi:hypothetical protein
LLKGLIDRYFYITEQEAQDMFDDEYEDFELEGDKYIAG